MADINKAIIIGHLTRDEELTYTPKGMAVGKISIAVNRRVKKEQEWVDEVNYFDVCIFGKQAQSLQRFLIKGKQIAVDGFLKQERWEKDGQKFSAVKIIANDIQLLGGKDGSSQNNGGYGDGSAGYDPDGYSYN